MIQRIQSVYLLIVTGLLVASMCMPIGVLTDANGLAILFKPLGFEANGVFQSTWGLFGILLLSAIISFATIFLFKNRVLQMRMSTFNSILLIGFYLALVAFYFALEKSNYTFHIHWALSFPIVSIILNVLAIRAIARDEVIVHAADRLR